MKRKIQCILLLIFIYQFGFSQHVINNPKYAFSNEKGFRVTQIDVSDTATILTFKLNFQAGLNFSILKENFIKASGSERILRSKGTIGYKGKLGDWWTMPDSGVVHFSIIYPPVDPSVEKIDFSETDNPNLGINPWKIYGIELRHVRHSLLPENLEGDWLNADGSNIWVAGLYEDKAIYNSRVWNYTSIRKKGNTTVISLKRGEETKILYVKYLSKSNCSINDKNSNPILCSLTPTLKQSYRIINDKPISQLFVKNDSAIVRGVIKSFIPDMYNKAEIVIEDVISGNDLHFPVIIQPDGSFEAHIPANYPHDVKIMFLGESKTVFMEPGKDLFIMIDLSPNAEDKLFSYYMGSNAALNVELSQSGITDYIYSPAIAKLFPKITFKQFIDSAQADYCHESCKLVEYKKSRQLSNKAIQILNSRLEMRRAGFLMDYNEYGQNEYYANRKNTVQNGVSKYKFQKLNDSAYVFVRKVLQDSMSIINNHSRLFISGTQQIPLMNQDPSGWDFVKYLFETFARKGVLTQDEKYLYETLEKDTMNNAVCKDSLLSNGKSIRLILEGFTKKHNSEIFSMSNDYYKNLIIKELNTIIGPKSLPIDLLNTKIYINQLEQFMVLSPEDSVTVRNEISNRTLANLIMAKNMQLKTTIERNRLKTGYHVNTVPEVSNDSLLLNVMLEKFKGKVVYITFWMPYFEAKNGDISKTASLKTELADKNVVFLYIALSSASNNLWENAITDIKGEHYLISHNQMDAISKKYKGNGVFTQMLVNKEGKIINVFTKFPTADELKAMLVKELAK
jgi:hypothetical protein